MTANTDQTADTDSGADVGHDLEAERTTAPMSDYSSSAVAIGFVVMLVGIGIAFGIPLLTVPL
ncbi:DUF7550 family protein [Natronorubrum sulfidifaciens]|uniref:Uncharacterized protein n=1 Tax=Natronorubrum sulfidifaciens JCM 14089 TaxID=1230460 RepID=L9VYX4_9EURY|nr:hypothetical protein [Natronorubrum sulfidifaciens]ELY42390.1 hypothetical protein C495_15337 [Natronorubrum sulfidifaciens JCM 14089]